ncbi:type II secretion system F family protein [Pararobbsia silviterrae]|uniref:Type II secretion system F family protein n=1 Tax=Pararobbsia silviterrae TaxID=1792498 RepID=A0A494XII8_9BURK|nr:type II secretion system F family protein [Pararobbsia silviterrae]RKP50378.1 type II secretion system F family protein [Pararobbsia silviterrae]
MDASDLFALSCALFAVALVLCGLLLIRGLRVHARSERMLEHALAERAAQIGHAARIGQPAHEARMPPAGAMRMQSAGTAALAVDGDARAGAQAGRAERADRTARTMRERLAALGMRGFETRLGKQLVASEDQLLLEQCGFVDPRAKGGFLIARVLCAFGVPLAASFAFDSVLGDGVVHATVVLFAALCFGFMVPKWVLARIAANRRQSVVDELPMLVDLLRLLQGVGLSIDQSVQVIVGEFRRVLPVLGQELEIANRQFVTGRTREQSLNRLGAIFDNDDLRALTRLIVQVDRHGGAVQEPLKQFAERLREARRTALRERIGKLTVKMTTVMITTLLPALLIVTAGPGFLAVIRSLSALAKP